jgi:hypothetical protein
MTKAFLMLFLVSPVAAVAASPVACYYHGQPCICNTGSPHPQCPSGDVTAERVYLLSAQPDNCHWVNGKPGPIPPWIPCPPDPK